MTDPIPKVEAKLSVKLLMGLIATALAIAGAVAGIMGAIYCTKSEMQVTKAELKDEVNLVKLKAEKAAGDDRVRDWQVQTVQVQMENVEKRQIQQTQNIEKLLTRFRVQPEPRPVMKSLPPPPKPEELHGDGD